MKATFGLECWAEKGGLALAQQDNNMSTTEIKKKKKNGEFTQESLLHREI